MEGISTRSLKKKSPEPGMHLSKAGNLSSILMLRCFAAESNPHWERREESNYLELVCKCLVRFRLDVPWLTDIWSCLGQELGREMLSGGFSPPYLG